MNVIQARQAGATELKVRRRRWFGLRDALTLSLLVGAVPALWPGVDLAISRAFFRPVEGFWLGEHPLVQWIYQGVPWLSRAAMLGLPIGILASFWIKTGPSPRTLRVRQALVCALIALVLGPGIIVNAFLKEWSGRARPVQVEAFGGSQQFTPALRLADQCAHNCAFVSGHAAVGFWAAGAYLITRRRRRGWLWAGIGVGLLVGLARLLAGGHWFSDVVFAMTCSLFGVAIAYLLAYRPTLRWRLLQARLRVGSTRVPPAPPASAL